MRLTADRKALLAAVSRVAGVPNARSPKPILQNLLMSVKAVGDDSSDGYTTTISATDMEIGVDVTVRGVQADGPGSAILPTGRIKQALALAVSDSVTIEVRDDKLHVTADGRHVFTSEDPALFPAVPPFDATDYHIVSPADLRRAIHRTKFATDPNSTKYALAGCLFDFSQAERLIVGATDGYRVARQSIGRETEGSPAPPAGQTIVPLKALDLIESMVDDGDPPVHLALMANGSAMLVRTYDATAYIRLVEGRFPAYYKAFEGESLHRVAVDSASLGRLIGQASIATSVESKGLDWTFSPGSLVISAESADIGQSHTEMPVEYDGPSVLIRLNGKHAADLTKAVACGLTIEFTDDVNAVLFRTDDDYVHALNPMTKVARTVVAVAAAARMDEEIAGAVGATGSGEKVKKAGKARKEKVPTA